MRETILVADSNVETRGLFYEAFSSLCYTVTCVPSAEEALARLADERFDLILLDEASPGVSGVDVAKKIRAFDKETKIIILTRSEPDAAIIKEAGPLRMAAVIKKDFDSHLMMKKILSVLKEGPSSAQEHGTGSGEKGYILLTDDNAEIRTVLEAFLSRRGHRVVTASGGEEALMKIKIERPDIVFLDMRMPGMDGLMVLKQIKEIDSTVKVVMLTSAHEEYIINEAKKQGACDYLIKPCNLEEVDALVTSLMVQK